MGGAGQVVEVYKTRVDSLVNVFFCLYSMDYVQLLLKGFVVQTYYVYVQTPNLIDIVVNHKHFKCLICF